MAKQRIQRAFTPENFTALMTRVLVDAEKDIPDGLHLKSIEIIDAEGAEYTHDISVGYSILLSDIHGSIRFTFETEDDLDVPHSTSPGSPQDYGR